MRPANHRAYGARLLAVALLAATACAGATPRVPPASNPGSGPAAAQFEGAALLRPARYRDWTFVTSGIDMSYSVEAMAMAGGDSAFDNVFADPAAYRAFTATGRWPDGTVLVTEVRRGVTEGSINKAGHFQIGAPMGLEVHVKDSARYGATGGWAFFVFGAERSSAPLPASADCYGCHRDHGLVDTTFVQFYPTLLEALKGNAGPR